MGSDKDRTVLVVGADLLGRARIEAMVAEAGFAALPVPAAKLSEVDMSSVAAIFADVDSDDVLDAITRLTAPVDALRVGYFAHVDRSRAERVKQAGWQALPRGRLFRELPSLLAEL